MRTMNHMVQLPSDRAEASPSDAELRRYFNENTWNFGRLYAEEGRVLSVQVSADGRHLDAVTKGSQSKPYTQSIALYRGADDRLRVSGLCSCPIRTNCKHVLAAVLHARARNQLAAVGSPRPAAAPVQVSGGALVQARQAPEPAALPSQLAGWLNALERDAADKAEEAPGTTRQRLLYRMARAHGGSRLQIQPVRVVIQRDGSLSSTGQVLAAGQLLANSKLPKYVSPSDRLILARLSVAGLIGSDPEAEDTLRRIIATGRAHWGDITGPVMHQAAPRPAQLRWDMQEDGCQRPTLVLDPPAQVMLLPAPWYVEPATGVVGPLQLPLPAAMVTRLLDAPPVPPEHAAQVRAELGRRMRSQAVPLPEEPRPAVELREPCRPVLRLLGGHIPILDEFSRFFSEAEPELLPLAELAFGYGPVTLPLAETRDLLLHQGRLYRPVRDRVAELDTLDQLKERGFLPVGRVLPTFGQHPFMNALVLPEEEAWLAFLLHEVPQLREQGWRVEIADNFPYQIAVAEGDWSAELTEGSGIDWLELHMGVSIDGHRVDLVPPLLAMIRSAGMAGSDLAEMLEAETGTLPLLIPLPDNRWVPLPLERIRPILLTLWDLFNAGGLDPDEGARFTRLDAASIAALEEVEGVVWQGGESLRALGRMLRDAGDRIPNAVVPASFRGALRPYQAQGVDWLQFLRAAELGGILADDMGLGKTVQTLAHLLIEQEAGRLTRPALIVCPTSLVPNWTMEAERFAPSLKLLPLHGPARKQRFEAIAAHDLVITTYPLLTRDHEVLTAQDWHVVVLDEAQTIKNPNAETTRQALRLQAGQRLCLSGTPLQNHLGELWSLFDFLAPGFLGSAKAFRTRFRTPIEKHGNAEIQARLNKRVRPFLLRRTKEQVAVDLPPKTEITEPVEMEAAQRGVYEAIRLAMHQRVKAAIAEKGLARSGIIILDALLKLRQACCDPRLLKLPAAQKAKAKSAKLERLMEMLSVMVDAGRRVLLFSQFTEMLALIEQALADAGIGYVMLTGDTKDRRTPVQQFQSGKVPLFLISLKAGGVGLNLTAADTVIHYDPWWNPAAEDQATDRAHRIGQTSHVFVHRLVTLGTIEEKMEVLKDRKRALVASVLQAEQGGALKLSEADVEALFGDA